MTNWALLRDAYGSAEAVPVLLAEAATATAGEDVVWDELWSRLCHQGTVYSASYAALPELAEMVARRAPAGFAAALHLAAAIVSSDDGPEVPELVRDRYAAHLPVLQVAAVTNLGHAGSDVDFIYGLQAFVAFQDGGAWQRNLECAADGEVQVQCPSCGDDLLIGLADERVVPGDPGPGTIEGRLRALTLDHGRTAVAGKLLRLFGTTTCPACAVMFGIPAALS